MFTGYADIKAVIDAINQGQIYRYLTKPWDPDELVAVLRQACDQYDRLAERRQLLLDLRDHAVRVPGAASETTSRRQAGPVTCWRGWTGR